MRQPRTFAALHGDSGFHPLTFRAKPKVLFQVSRQCRNGLALGFAAASAGKLVTPSARPSRLRRLGSRSPRLQTRRSPGRRFWRMQRRRRELVRGRRGGDGRQHFPAVRCLEITGFSPIESVEDVVDAGSHGADLRGRVVAHLLVGQFRHLAPDLEYN